VIFRDLLRGASLLHPKVLEVEIVCLSRLQFAGVGTARVEDAVVANLREPLLPQPTDACARGRIRRLVGPGFGWILHTIRLQRVH
jgi:hypothetical protein